METENGFYIKRKWNIVPEGNVELAICVDVVSAHSTPYFIPCIASGASVPSKGFVFLGERLTHPSGIYLFPEEKGIFISTDIPAKDGAFSSIHLTRIKEGKYNCSRVEMNLPPYEKFPENFEQKEGFIQGPGKVTYQSKGDLNQSLGVNVIISDHQKIFPVSTGIAHKNMEEQGSTGLTKRNFLNDIKRGIDRCLGEHLVENKGVFGIRDHGEGETLSMFSTINLALLMQMIFTSNEQMFNTSIMLADFSLKAQHPSGLFYEKYFYKQNSWIDKSLLSSLKKEEEVRCYLSLKENSLIAWQLLEFASRLKEKELLYNKYFIGARRFIDFCFNREGDLKNIGSRIDVGSAKFDKPNLECLYLVFPLIKLFRMTGDEKYKEAALLLKKDFYPSLTDAFSLPVREKGEEPDFESALLLLKAANSFEELGIAMPEKENLLNKLLPWINYNSTTRQVVQSITGGIMDSFSRCRIIFRGYELACQLLKLKESIEDDSLKDIVKAVSGDLIAFSSRNAPGRPFINHTLWIPSGNLNKPLPADSIEYDTNAFTRESLYLYELYHTWPEYLEQESF